MLSTDAAYKQVLAALSNRRDGSAIPTATKSFSGYLPPYAWELELAAVGKSAGVKAGPVLTRYYEENLDVSDLRKNSDVRDAICGALFRLDIEEAAHIVLRHIPTNYSSATERLQWAAQVCKRKGEWNRLVAAIGVDDHHARIIGEVLKGTSDTALDAELLISISREGGIDGSFWLSAPIATKCKLLSRTPTPEDEKVLARILRAESHLSSFSAKMAAANALARRGGNPRIILDSLSELVRELSNHIRDAEIKEILSVLKELRHHECAPFAAALASSFAERFGGYWPEWLDDVLFSCRSSPGTVASLCSLLDHKQVCVSAAASKALGRMSDTAAVPALVQTCAHKEALPYRHKSTRIPAAEALLKILANWGHQVSKDLLTQITGLEDIPYCGGEYETFATYDYSLRPLRELAQTALNTRT